MYIGLLFRSVLFNKHFFLLILKLNSDTIKSPKSEIQILLKSGPGQIMIFQLTHSHKTHKTLRQQTSTLNKQLHYVNFIIQIPFFINYLIKKINA